MSERSIFIQALELDDPVERAALLSRECGTDAELLQRVERLLAAHAAAGGILDKPPVEPPATDLFRPITEAPGTIIGPYKLLQQIGEGGFGLVYMAEQQRPVRRKVALKIIKPGMDTREVIARFESERQALALMDHPNIARVLDAGATDSGRPYFVMELVKGVPITEYCDKNALPTDKRLALFITVCHAIQHAHQKGVIHRDLKPSNVMVTLHDGQPVPKVIDFGVSKAISQQLTEKTLFTAYGQMIGTPAYMSPEQAEMSGLDIDTRSDTYSLGVLLYELLTGTTPFDGKRLREAGYVEMQRIIREEAPPRPSTRVSTMGDALTIISSHRSIDPKKLGQQLRGDLDVIVMKAMEKERGRRYDTPNAVADDIQRFLNHEAIVARPASAAYRLKKFTQRNWAAVAAGSAIVAALLIGTILSTALAIHALQQRNLANRERATAETAQQEAERHRDHAEKSKREESKQRQLAEEREADAKTARQNEAAQLAVAKAERDKATSLADELQREKDELNRRKEQQRRMLYVAQMSLIQKAWDSDNMGRVRDLLNASRPRPGEEDLRNIEWHYWQRMLHQEERSFKLGESLIADATGRAPPSIVAFSRDGTRLAAIVSQGRSGLRLKVWDTDTERKLFDQELPADPAPGASTRYHIGYVDAHRVAISEEKRPDTSDLRAAFERERSAGPEGRARFRELVERPRAAVSVVLRVLQLDTQEEAFPPIVIKSARSVPIATSGHFAFNHDGSRFAALMEEQTGESGPTAFLQIWDGRTGAPLARVKAPATSILALALSSDGTRVATAQPPIRQARSGDELRLQPLAPGQIEIVDVASGSIVSTTATYTRPIMTFSPDGTRLAVLNTVDGRTGRGATVFNTTTGGEIFRVNDSDELSTLARFQTHLSFSPDQQWLVYCGYTPGRTESASIQLWNAATGEKGPKFKGNVEPPDLVAFSADSQRLVSVHPSGIIKVWRLPVPRERGAFTEATIRESRQRLTANSPDTRWRASAPRYDTRYVTQSPPPPPYQITWSNELDQRQARSADLAGPVEQLEFSADSKLLFAISIDPEAKLEDAAELKVWDVASGKERLVHRFAAREPSRPSAFGESAQRERVRSASATIEVSPDGQRLALTTTSRSTSVLVWSLADGQLLFVKPGNFRHPQFSPDAKILLSQSFTSAAGRVGYELQAWNADTGELLWKDAARVTPRAFSADSKRLAALRVGSPSNSEESTIVVWDAASGTVIAELHLPATRIVGTLSLSAEGRQLALVTADRVAIYAVDAGVTTYTLENYGTAVQSARFSPDGQRILTSTQPEPSAVNSRNFGRRSNLFGFNPPDPPAFISGLFRSSPAEIRVYDANTGQELLTGTTDSAPLASLAHSSTLRLEPLSPRVQAEELVDLLAGPGADGRLAPRSEIARRIEADTSLSDESRKLAGAELAALQRSAPMLTDHAWKIVQSPDRDRDEYERAKELIYEADGQSPVTDYPIALGVVYYRLGEYATALTELERGAQLTSDGRRASNAVDGLFFLAMTQHQLGNAEQARETFYQAERESLRLSGPTSIFVLNDRGARDRGSAAATTRLDGHSLAEAATLLGVKTIQSIRAESGLLSDADFSRVLAYYNERIRETLTGTAYYERFNFRNGHGDRDYALDDIEEAVRLEPRNAIYINNRGWTLWRMGELDRALADQNEAAELDPQYVGAYVNRGTVWSLKGEYDKALQDLDAALRLTSGQNIKSLVSRGWVWEKLGQPEKAQADFSASLQLPIFSKPADAYRGRARLWMERREYDRAIADYDQAILLEPENPDNFYFRGVAWRDKGGYGKAFEDFDKVIGLAPTFPNAYRQSAWILATCHDEIHRDGRRALELATKAVELTREKNAQALATLAAACAEIGNFPGAIEQQEKAITLATLAAEKADNESRLALYRADEPYRERPAGNPTAIDFPPAAGSDD